jgi:hypothetical protein
LFFLFQRIFVKPVPDSAVSSKPVVVEPKQTAVRNLKPELEALGCAKVTFSVNVDSDALMDLFNIP